MKRGHLILILIISFLEVFTHFGALAPDSHHFFNASYFFLGVGGFPNNPVGIVRPLLPLLASFLSPFLSLPMAYALINSLLYPLSGIICYKLSEKITESSAISLISSIMLLTSFSMVSYGASAYYMGAAIFFELLVAYLALRLGRNLSTALLVGFLSGIGALAGEAVLIYIGFGFFLWIYRRKISNALAYLAVATILPMLIPSMLGCSLIDFYFRFNIEYARSLGLLTASYWFNIFRRITLLAAGLSLLDLAGLFIGFLAEKSRSRIRLFYLMFGLTLLAWLCWVPSERRHVYIFYPSVQWMSAIGVYWIAERLSEKPLLRLLNTRAWLIILVLANAILTNGLSYVWYLEGNLEGIGSIPGLSLPI